MSEIRIHQDKIPDPAGLEKLCPFGAIVVKENGTVEITSGCKFCKVCVKKGPKGAFEFLETKSQAVDKTLWNGILVYVEHEDGMIHPITYELLGKASELAKKSNQKVYALIAGQGVRHLAEELRPYEVDEIFIYDDPGLKYFRIEPYAAVFEDLVRDIQPSVVLVGGTSIGRSLAPRVAARFRTGLTADCTFLDINKSSDLDQIRPAFGGNIMAHIQTPNTRPQFATVRYKIFSTPERSLDPRGKITPRELSTLSLESRMRVLGQVDKPKVVTIEQADVVIAAGRGIRSKNDLKWVQTLADQLDGMVGVTRPLIEAGWADPRQQIGLSGRTIRPRLIITCGISGAIQFVAGMKGSECIVAINKDPEASIFKIAHYAIVGDLYEVLPGLCEKINQLNSESEDQNRIRQRQESGD